MKKDELLIKLGKRIQCLRKAQNLSQEKLAENADIHSTYFAQVERGEVNPSFKILHKIAEGLKISVVELFSFPPDTDKLVTKEEVLISNLIGLVKGRDEKTIRMIENVLKDIIKWMEGSILNS